MHPDTLALFAAAQDAVTRLVEACHKQQPLYRHSPQAVAQVSRTSRWLLHAIDRLHRDLAARDDSPES
jgi:hypothetical protein